MLHGECYILKVENAGRGEGGSICQPQRREQKPALHQDVEVCSSKMKQQIDKARQYNQYCTDFILLITHLNYRI